MQQVVLLGFSSWLYSRLLVPYTKGQVLRKTKASSIPPYTSLPCRFTQTHRHTRFPFAVTMLVNVQLIHTVGLEACCMVTDFSSSGSSAVIAPPRHNYVLIP